MNYEQSKQAKLLVTRVLESSTPIADKHIVTNRLIANICFAHESCFKHVAYDSGLSPCRKEDTFLLTFEEAYEMLGILSLPVSMLKKNFRYA